MEGTDEWDPVSCAPPRSAKLVFAGPGAGAGVARLVVLPEPGCEEAPQRLDCGGGPDPCGRMLQELEEAISTGDAEAARTLARDLALRRPAVDASVDRDTATASCRRQLQASLIGMGYAPPVVVQALRRGGAQSVGEAVAWIASTQEGPAAGPRCSFVAYQRD
mmetsp:Transcript_128422/g.363425  ORF Transcript_128422/g.363425 Transcript_128422/m.363425 type:complete len:163 (+) Transcript_128422:101-589(+)